MLPDPSVSYVEEWPTRLVCCYMDVTRPFCFLCEGVANQTSLLLMDGGGGGGGGRGGDNSWGILGQQFSESFSYP